MAFLIGGYCQGDFFFIPHAHLFPQLKSGRRWVFGVLALIDSSGGWCTVSGRQLDTCTWPADVRLSKAFQRVSFVSAMLDFQNKGLHNPEVTVRCCKRLYFFRGKQRLNYQVYKTFLFHTAETNHAPHTVVRVIFQQYRHFSPLLHSFLLTVTMETFF